MEFRGDIQLALRLREKRYRQIESAFDAGRLSVYMLAEPVPAPALLAEFHLIAEAYYSVEIRYSPSAPGENPLRVITWYDIPGQQEITPENAFGFRAAEVTAADAEVDGRSVTGTLGTAGESWVWSATVRESHLLVTGRGEMGHLSLTSTGDFAAAVAGGKAFTERNFR
ncbi:hypothetical protein [Streptomyces sp. NPDC087270]|uniref:hypothetical protein n=1 Tax=Streptomyces sp. NPDC087270 TaxID=3365774 RepID=UPI00381D0CCA